MKVAINAHTYIEKGEIYNYHYQKFQPWNSLGIIVACETCYNLGCKYMWNVDCKFISFYMCNCKWDPICASWMNGTTQKLN